MHLYPGVRVHPLNHCGIEISYGMLPVIRFVDLTPAEFDWLLRQRSPHALRPSESEDLASQPHSTTHAIAQRLIALGFASAQSPYPRSQGITKELACESLALRAQGLNSSAILNARSRATVAIKGVNQVSLELLRTLALSGVRNFIIDDPRTANSVEFSALANFPHEVATRGEAAQQYLQLHVPAARTVSLNHEPTVAVVSCSTTTDELEAASLTVSSVATLELWNVDGHFNVGPFSVPESSRCISCLNEASGLSQAMLTDHRASWEFESTTLQQNLFVPHSAVRAALCGSLAAQQILQYLDGELPETTSRLISSRPQALVWEKLDYTAQADCLCAQLC